MTSALRAALFLCAAIVVLIPATAYAQFSWDGECSIFWHDCCIQGENYVNNWSTTDSPTACPPLPGPTDYAIVSGLVDSQGPIISIAGLGQSGTFLCRAQHLNIMGGDISTTGSILEPSTFQLLSSTINLYDGATLHVGSFSTLDLRSGQIQSSGKPGQILVVGSFGTMTKTAEPAADARLAGVPFDNQGLISVPVGTLIVDSGGSSTGTIEALDDGILYFEGGTYDLAGEVRGDGLMHFHNGTANIIGDAGDYNAINTLIGGSPAVVNFENDTSVENLTLTSAGAIGGAGTLAIDDLTWYPPSTILPGGVLTVLDTAQFLASQGQHGLQRDVELYGSATLAPSAQISMTQAEMRNHGQFDLLGDSTIKFSGDIPSSNLKNSGTLRKTGGGTSIIAVGLSSDGGAINIESGTLILDGQMGGPGDITVDAGATLEFRNNQQSVFPESSLTGAGTVIFNGGSGSSDVVEGAYDVAKTVIYYSTAEFDSDVTIETLELVNGTLAGDGELTVTGDLNFAWGNSTLGGNGMTKALGPVRMSFDGYLDRVFEIDNATAGNPEGAPLNGTMWIPANSMGELRGHGSLDGNVSDLAGIAPGVPSKNQPIGSLTITGNFTQYSSPPGNLRIDINGAAHDELIIGGSATLSGNLIVTGSPTGGQSYTILGAQNIIGTFAQTNLPEGMTVSYTPTSVIVHAAPGAACPADIAPGTGNGIVDVDDLLLVINNWGAVGSNVADITGDGNVDTDDLLAVINAWGVCE